MTILLVLFGILIANVLFFGTLAVNYLIEERGRRREQRRDGQQPDCGRKAERH